MTINLNDLQRVLLSTASQRDDGSVLPYAGSLDTERVRKAIPALLKRGLIAEQRVTGAVPAWREDEDGRYGLFLTEAGKAALGLDEEAEAGKPTTAAPAPKTPRQTKTSTVIALLERTEGATLAELIAATGWLPHTTRAALTGLRTKGHAIARSKRDDATCYRIVAAA